MKIRFAPLAAGLLLLNTMAPARTIVVDNRHAAADDENPGTREAPFLTINAAAQIAEAGDTVLVRPGLYREAVVIPNSGREDAPIVFQSEEIHQAVVSGSDLLTDWQTEGAGVWFKDWPDMRRMHADNNAEWIYLDGFPLWRSYDREEMIPGTFYQDLDAKRIYITLEEEDDIGAHQVEYAWRQGLFRATAWHHHQQRWADWQDFIQIRGFTVQHDASWVRGMHAIRFLGRGWVIEDNHIRWVSSRAISGIGKDVVIRNNRIEWAGQLALGGHGANLLVEDNRILYANWLPVFPWWEAGSTKYTTIIDSVFRNNHCAYTWGGGIWFDGWAFGNLVEHNISHDIYGPGFFTEIDLPGQIFHRNISFNNFEGINIAETSGVLARRNIVFNNRIGIRMRGRYHRKFGDGYHQAREPEGALRTRLTDFERLGVSPLRLRQLEAAMYIYYFGPDALMSNNNAIWENIVFENDTNYFEQRNYAEPSDTDPFINNFSNHNIWYASEPERYFSHGEGSYDSLEHWQEVSGRDGKSTIVNPRDEEDAPRLPEWAQEAEPYWREPNRTEQQLIDLDLQLTEGATAAIARARIRRSPLLEPVETGDPALKAYLLKMEGERVLALWLAHGTGARRDRAHRTHTLERRQVGVRLDADRIVVENRFLHQEEVAVADGVLRVAVSWMPVYVRGVGDVGIVE